MVDLVYKSSVAQGLKSFYNSIEDPNKKIELYNDTLMVRFQLSDKSELKRHWVAINANDSVSDDATFLKIWINSKIKIYSFDDEVKISEIRKMINHANRNLIIGKIWFEEYSNDYNLRWYSYTQIFGAKSISNSASAVNLIYKNAVEEFDLWYKIFSEISKENSDFIKILRRFKIDLSPYV